MIDDDRTLEALRLVRGRVSADLAVLVAERRADVVTWRNPGPGTHPHWPEPWANERWGREPYWLDDSRDTGVRVGFDVADRPVICELERGDVMEPRVDEVWLHGEGWSDRITPGGAFRLLFEDGRVVVVVGVDRGQVQLERWTWDGGVPARGDMAWVSEDRTVSMAKAAEVDDGGRLLRLRTKLDDSPRLDGDEREALARALRRAGELVPDQVGFDYRLGRRESQMRQSEELVPLLAEAMEQAVAAAVAESGIEEPFVVEVRLREDEFPPFIRVGGARFRDRMRSLSPEANAALASLFKAEPPDGVTVELTDLLGDEPLRACRELNWALSTDQEWEHPDRQRAVEACERLGRDLGARLNARDWPGAAESFLVLVNIGHPYRDLDPFELALPGAGPERVAAFRASVASQAVVLAGLPDASRHDREALAALLAERGLSEEAERIASEVAEVGLRLQPATGGKRSRLGGPALLPPGEQWPHARGKRPLTFLAGLDLAELPFRDGLPEAGWLLFFADLDNDEADGLIDEATNMPGEPARLFYLPAGADPLEVEPPASLNDVLEPRLVEAVAQLTLPDDYEVGRRLGLDAAQSDAYEEIANLLRYGDQASWSDEGKHWVLGAWTGVQGDPTDDDATLLLHMAWDEELGFEFLDGGAIQFRIARSALEARDWSAVVAEADSC